MRAAFGLGGLLVAVGVIVWLWSVNHPADTVRTAQKAQEQAEQFSGGGVRESIRLEPRLRNGRLQSLHVNYLARGAPLEKHYGLKRDDLIVKIGPMEVREFDDVKDGMDWLVQAYQTNRELTVMREGKEIVLQAGASQAADAVEGPRRSSPMDQAEALKERIQSVPGR